MLLKIYMKREVYMLLLCMCGIPDVGVTLTVLYGKEVACAL